MALRYDDSTINIVVVVIIIINLLTIIRSYFQCSLVLAAHWTAFIGKFLLDQVNHDGLQIMSLNTACGPWLHV